MQVSCVVVFRGKAVRTARDAVSLHLPLSATTSAVESSELFARMATSVLMTQLTAATPRTEELTALDAAILAPAEVPEFCEKMCGGIANIQCGGWFRLCRRCERQLRPEERRCRLLEDVVSLEAAPTCLPQCVWWESLARCMQGWIRVCGRRDRQLRPQAQVELTALDAVRWTQEECLHLLRNLLPVRRCVAGLQTSSVMQVLCVLVMRGKAVRTARDAVCRTVHRAVRHCRCAGRASGRRSVHAAGPRTRTSATLRRCAALPSHVCVRSCDS